MLLSVQARNVQPAAARWEADSIACYARPMQIALDNLNPGVMVITVSATTLVYQQRYSLVVQVLTSVTTECTSQTRS